MGDTVALFYVRVRGRDDAYSVLALDGDVMEVCGHEYIRWAVLCMDVYRALGELFAHMPDGAQRGTYDQAAKAAIKQCIRRHVKTYGFAVYHCGYMVKDVSFEHGSDVETTTCPVLESYEFGVKDDRDDSFEDGTVVNF